MNFRFLTLLLLMSLIGNAAEAAGLQVNTVRAQTRSGRPGLVLFASVEPVQTVVVRAAATGRLADFHVRPGDDVRAGEPLGHLAGPTYAATLASSLAALDAARTAYTLARDRLKVTRIRYPVLADRGALDQAKLEVTHAAAALTHARASFAALSANGQIIAPVGGTIAEILRGNGERVAPSDGIVDIHPAGSLWLRGTVYGDTARFARLGMRGRFRPTGGGKPVSVRVIKLIPGRANDGRGVGLVALSGAPPWFDGESGLVTLTAAKPREPAVPTSALVLDRGHWWVVEKIKGRFEPVQVTPDGVANGWTWIAVGIKLGDEVVVTNPYLLFHRTFSRHYASD